MSRRDLDKFRLTYSQVMSVSRDKIADYIDALVRRVDITTHENEELKRINRNLQRQVSTLKTKMSKSSKPLVHHHYYYDKKGNLT